MNRGNRIWIVCPVYRDVESFTILREQVLVTLEHCLRDEGGALETKFVVVDDTAGEDAEISKLDAFDDVLVITPPFNLGHQRAIVFGLRMIVPRVGDLDVVVTMDADGEDQPSDLPRMLAPVVRSPKDEKIVCVARRTKRHEPVYFRAMYLFFVVFFRALTGVSVRSGNFAAYRGHVARQMLMHPAFDVCYSSTLISFESCVRQVPCARGRRYAGRSRMSPLRLFMHGIRMLVPFTDRIAVRALTIFAVTFAAGIGLSLAVLVIRLATTSAIPGWATTAILGTLLFSFIALGNFLMLFIVFSHSRGISLAGLEDQVGRGRPGSLGLPPTGDGERDGAS